MADQHTPPYIRSFYHLTQERGEAAYCQGAACFVARHLDPQRWQRAASDGPRVYCLGKCYLAPASSEDQEPPRMEVDAPEAVVLANLVAGGARSLARYVQRGGYSALQRALSLPPQTIIEIVEASGLRGRGGAGFPTGRKWRAVFSQPSQDKYVIANADEGDPGAYVDRMILEDDPLRMIEGLAIAGYAMGATKGYVYLRSEYPQAYQALQNAIAEAGRGGYLGISILGTSFSFDIELVQGWGSYVCGEETALINSLAGKRPEVMPRPPYPTEHGLFGRPTLVNNVETLATVPWIVSHGGEAYHALGFSTSRGTKVVTLNSLFCRPGLYEVEFGVTLRHIVEELGGGLRTGTIKGIIIGGPLAGVVPPELLDTPLGFDELRAIGAGVGHGGILAFDEHTSLSELIHHVFDFAAYESCGKCTPCRLGTRRVQQLFQGILRGDKGTKQERGEWEDILDALATTSLCGLGTGVAEFARSIVRHYPKELDTCFV